QITEKQYKNWYTLRINKIRKKKIEITRKSKEIRYILTSDEEEAYSLEGFLISAFHPPLNHTIGKYKFIEITLNEEIPRLLISTGKYSEDSYLYGPFEHSTNLEVAIDGFLQFFRLCNSPKPCERISPQHIPCLRYHMHRCLGPCKDNNSNIKKEYQKELQAFINSLKNNGKQVVDYLTQMMNKKIKVNDFKVAALYRDRINAIKIMFEKKCFPYLIRKYYSQLKKVLGATPYFKIIYDIYTENNMKSNRTFFQ
ncbi:MAG: hypothetical protein U9O98_04205, partial [Asgard group archaeon]|nr:hypothetical protein [Asgard group archaeon]